MKEQIELIFTSEVESLEGVDLKQTIAAIEGHVKKSGLFEIVSWRDSERLAFLVLDWMSMHEAVWERS